MNRRKFMGALGSVGAAGILSQVFPGCLTSKSTSSLPPDQTGSVMIDVSRYPELNSIGGAAEVITDQLPRALIVVRKDRNNWKVLDSWCTHQGCIVRKVGTTLHCPCHNSKYTFDGEVIQGPSTLPLVSYKWELSGNQLTVHLDQRD